MKYIHIPKTKNIIIFSVLIIVAMSLNFPFFLMQKSVIAYNLDALLILHMLLPIIYGVIICMLFSYLLMTFQEQLVLL